MSMMQNKIMAAIRKTIADVDLDCVEKWHWGNIADLYVQRHGDFETFFTIHVDFQSDRMTGSIFYKNEHLCNGFTHKGNEMIRDRSFLIDYADGAKLKAFLAKIAQESSVAIWH
jgi:hypothetical protein